MNEASSTAVSYENERWQLSMSRFALLMVGFAGCCLAYGCSTERPTLYLKDLGPGPSEAPDAGKSMTVTPVDAALGVSPLPVADAQVGEAHGPEVTVRVQEATLASTPTAAPGAKGQQDPQTTAPRVLIRSPGSGATVESAVLVSGSLVGAQGDARLAVNGRSQSVVVSASGEFSSPVVLGPGRNVIALSARGSAGKLGRSDVELVSSPPTAELRIVLIWDSVSVDLDLEVLEPGGVVVRGELPVAETSGRVTAAGVGQGSETYARTKASPGDYKIRVRVSGAVGQGETSVRAALFYTRKGQAPQRVDYGGQLKDGETLLELGSYTLSP